MLLVLMCVVFVFHPYFLLKWILFLGMSHMEDSQTTTGFIFFFNDKCEVNHKSNCLKAIKI